VSVLMSSDSPFQVARESRVIGAPPMTYLFWLSAPSSVNVAFRSGAAHGERW
jgi:hypothetical protein